jgi:hypothetical protein
LALLSLAVVPIARRRRARLINWPCHSALVRRATAVAEMGARARQMLDEKVTKAQAIAHWTELVDQLGTVSN